MSESTLERTSIDRRRVEDLLREIGNASWGREGRAILLVETPQPHRHVARDHVHVVAGKGFAGDHARKSYYRGAYVEGREVSAVTKEVLDVVGVDPVVVGDNLITEGVDLAALREGDLVRAGDVLLERSRKAHRPCVTFRSRSSPEAFAVVSKSGYRGALFIVKEGGILRKSDRIEVLERRRDAI